MLTRVATFGLLSITTICSALFAENGHTTIITGDDIWVNCTIVSTTKVEGAPGSDPIVNVTLDKGEDDGVGIGERVNLIEEGLHTIYVVECDKKSSKCIAYFECDATRLLGKAVRTRRVDIGVRDEETLDETGVSRLTGLCFKEYLAWSSEKKKTTTVTSTCISCGATFVFSCSMNKIVLSNHPFLTRLLEKYRKGPCKHHWADWYSVNKSRRADRPPNQTSRPILGPILGLVGHLYTFRVVIEYMEKNCQDILAEMCLQFLDLYGKDTDKHNEQNEITREEKRGERDEMARKMMYNLLNILRDIENPLDSKEYVAWVEKYFPK